MLQDEQAATSRKKSKGNVSAAGSLAAAAWFAVAAVAHASRHNLGSCKIGRGCLLCWTCLDSEGGFGFLLPNAEGVAIYLNVGSNLLSESPKLRGPRFTLYEQK